MNLKNLVLGSGRLSEVIRFGMVGGVCTLVQYGIYVVFSICVGIPATVSTIISYVLSFLLNFFLSSKFTFRQKASAKRGVGFTISHLVNMGLQVGLVAIFQQLIGKTLALLPALAICIPVNYLMVRYAFTSKIFKSKKERNDLSTL